MLTPPQATPFAWQVRQLCFIAYRYRWASSLSSCLVCLFPWLLVPLALAAVIFMWLLRRYEKTEPEIIVRMPPQHSQMLARLEDHDVTNQFTVLGSVKPTSVSHASP